MTPEIKNKIFGIINQDDFLEMAQEIFRYQAHKNQVYSKFLKSLRKDYSEADSLIQIPFLPAGFFRDNKVVTGNKPAEIIFESSGTKGTLTARHYVSDLEIYKESFLRTFSGFFGDPSQYFIAALLPSYTERENSSLVFMMDEIIKSSNYNESGFYNNNIPLMLSRIETAKNRGRKIFLMGVSFALIDLAEKYHPDLSGIIIVETGGMKGRRKELTRGELHFILKSRFNADTIHSEYGMTELLSQAYSKEGGRFYSPPWMKIFIRDLQDPLSVISQPGETGGINIIDLANINSCSFIATDDLGKVHEDGSFEVLGRLDNSDIRGCNLMIE